MKLGTNVMQFNSVQSCLLQLATVDNSHAASVNELWYLSRYSDKLWAGQTGFFSPYGQEICLFPTVFRPFPGPTQSPMQ